ncbi:MAG: hypothetical protein JNM59_05225 [Hyphomonadaceae bacterium]|nr:hypothetical protein [Hyphomonadaceae bacterium]
MRGLVYVLLACLALWAAWFATRTGVLVFEDLYMMSDADGIAFDPTTGATEPPVGRLCFYMTASGLRKFALIDREEWDFIVQARNGGTDPELADYALVDGWTDSACPLFRAFPRERG